MTSRSERKAILEARLGARLRGLKKEPCLTAFLDAMDAADSEGLNEMVEALIAEIKRSGHGGGFLLELDIAIALFQVPKPRTLRYGQKEGLAKGPGDVWLDWNGRRYEFQCKHIMNWSVELWCAEATDRIERELASITPGRFYDLKVGLEGTQDDWRAFAQWVIENFLNWQYGQEKHFCANGRYVASITLHPSQDVGMHFHSSVSSVQCIPIDFLRQKLNDALQKARQSFSAKPSSTHINCLVIDIDNLLIKKRDLFYALYGEECYTVTRYDDGTCVGEPAFNFDGLFSVDPRWDILSAVVWPKLKGCDPLAFQVTVFPNPKYFQDVVAAFQDMPGFMVVQSLKEVER